ncbi:MAG: hypothetical protein H7Y17_03145 [Chlorobia bacterium]|nr:hypothetical protein [Fimbriimonadaceae bacterium]
MLLLALAISQATSKPIAPERPLISLSFSVPSNAGEDEYLASIREQIRFGLNGFYISVKWGDIETSPGSYNFKSLEDSLGLAKLLGADVAVNFQSIDTTNRGLPSDLATAEFDSPEVQTRFQSFLAEASKKLNKRVKWISLGNEVDAYLSAHPNEVPAYLQLMLAGRKQLKQSFLSALIGVTCTYDGYQKNPELVEKLEAWTEVVFMTYYPMTQQFGPRPISEVPSDFAALTKLAAGRKLLLQEIGLPASEIVGSSEQIQADFVSEVFKQLSKHSSRIAFANYFLQYDFPPQLLDVFETYYGIKDEKFRAFLGSLGIRKTDGTPRKAWSRFRDETISWFKISSV